MKHSGYNLLRYSKNSRGLNTRDTITNIDAGYARALLNIEFDITGAISKRKGYFPINSSAISGTPEFKGLAQYDIKTGAKFVVAITATDQKVWKMDDLDGTFDDITGSVVISASEVPTWNFTIGLDTLIGVSNDGVNVPIKYTGSGNAAPLTISQFTHSKRVLFYKNRLIHFNIKESSIWYPGRVRWSDVETLETYTSANYLNEAGSSDGSEIVGAKILLDDIYIFKNSLTNGIKRMFYIGSDLLTFSIINMGAVGTISGDSVVNVDLPGVGPVLIYWGMDNKIRVFDGGKSYPLSDNIQPTLNGLNTQYNKYIQAVNYAKKSQVWFFCYNGAPFVRDYVIIFDYKNNAWFIFDNVAVNASAILTDSNNLEILATGNYIGRLLKHDFANADIDGVSGGDYNSYWKSVWNPVGNPSIIKRIRWMDVYAAQSGNWNLTIKWSFNFNDSSPKSTTINVNQLNPHKGIDLYDYGNTKYISIEFHQNVKNNPWTVYEYDLWAKPLGVKNV